MRRPRLYWCSWSIQADQRCSLVSHPDFDELQLNMSKPVAGHWVDKGWRRSEKAGFMCTLGRRIPTASPPAVAASLAGASEEAIARWKSDNHGFQDQYEDRHLIFDAEDRWKLLSAQERELLMGFDREYTAAAVPTKDSKETAFTIRCSALGNSFHVYSVSFLVSHLLDQLYGAPLNLPLENFC